VGKRYKQETYLVEQGRGFWGWMKIVGIILLLLMAAAML
jgi:hypothetical protein